MKVRPLHDRMLVRRIEEKETAKGGIIIPDSAKEKPQEGKVLAVGNGKILENGTKVALDHVLEGAPLPELVAAALRWQPGWIYALAVDH